MSLNKDPRNKVSIKHYNHLVTPAKAGVRKTLKNWIHGGRCRPSGTFARVTIEGFRAPIIVDIYLVQVLY
ncbi:MAG: hypothetical protein WCA08_04335 [Desulfoferrobacter sp.]